MIDLVIGNDTRQLQLHQCGSTRDLSTNKEIIKYKWVEAADGNESVPDQDFSIPSYHNFSHDIPFDIIYSKTYRELQEYLVSEGAFGCFIIAEPDFLVEDFCSFVAQKSNLNYKIDLSKYAYSYVYSNFFFKDVGLTDQFTSLSLSKSDETFKSLLYYLPHLPLKPPIYFMIQINAKQVYAFEDLLVLITIHAVSLQQTVKESDSNRILITLSSVEVFSIAADTEERSFHVFQMLDLLALYMKAWKEVNLPIKFIVPFEKFPDNPLHVLSSSDLISKFFRLPFPLTKAQRRFLLSLKIDENEINPLVNSTNGFTLAEMLNLPKMRGWEGLKPHEEFREPDVDLIDFTDDSNIITEPHVVVGMPGVGKTTYATCLAKKLNVPLVRLSVTEFMRPEIGASELELTNFFKNLDKYNSDDISCVLLLESLDAVKSYNVTSVVSREINKLLSDNYWKNNNIVIVVTLMGDIENLENYEAIRRFKILKIEPLNLEKTAEIMGKMLGKTFKDSKKIVDEWKSKQESDAKFTISQIKDIVEGSKMKSLTRLLEEGEKSDLTLVLDDLTRLRIN